MPSEEMKAIPNITEFRIQQNNYRSFFATRKKTILISQNAFRSLKHDQK
jgi:hypothetical protein